MSSTACIILAAGEGTRLKSKLPKALQLLCGRPLISHVLAAVQPTEADPIVAVVKAGREAMMALLKPSPVQIVDQPELLGTGHAVMCAEPILADFSGDILITCADIPLVRPATLHNLIQEHQRTGAAATILTAIFDDPSGYGRIIRNEQGLVQSIVEHKDADPQTRQIKEINTSIYCFQAQPLFAALHQISPDNAQDEYYLTDVIPQLLGRGLPVAAVVADDPDEVMGINTRAQQAAAEQVARQRVRQRLMEAGVTLIDPPSTFIDDQVRIGRDTVVWPGAFIRGNTQIGEDCVIGGHTLISDCQITDGVHIYHCSVVADSQVGQGVQIGPFAHIRDETTIQRDSYIGSFAEVVRSHLGPQTIDKHFSYLGDARLGSNVNIGAGVITCNYDGRSKHLTIIEDGAFVGSDAAIVAPVTIGKGAYVGAGSVITKDVPAGSLAVGRADQKTIEGWADRRRSRE